MKKFDLFRNENNSSIEGVYVIDPKGVLRYMTLLKENIPGYELKRLRNSNISDGKHYRLKDGTPLINLQKMTFPDDDSCVSKYVGQALPSYQKHDIG